MNNEGMSKGQRDQFEEATPEQIKDNLRIKINSDKMSSNSLDKVKIHTVTNKLMKK